MGQYSGPCPLCSHLIVTSTSSSFSLLPASLPVFTPPAVVASPPAVFPAVLEETLSSRRPDTQRINRTGNFTFRPLGLEDIPNRLPAFDQELPESDPPRPSFPRNSTTTRSARITALRLKVVATVLLVVVATVVASGWSLRDKKQQNLPVTVLPVEELRMKLQAGALESLKAILAADDPAAIAKHLIGGAEMIPAIQDRLKSAGPFQPLSEEDVVSTIPMDESDLRRSFSGFHYQAALNDAMSLDSPLLTAGMASGSDGLSLLEGAAVIGNITAPAPRQAIALFAERKGQHLLDWDLFIQTWDRTLIAFSDGELGDGPLPFRVIMSRDKPVFANGESVDKPIIRMRDPLHATDILRVQVDTNDPPDVLLRPTPQALEKDPDAAVRERTATVSLLRDPETGRISIERIICWEYLGLGGWDGNTDPEAKQLLTSRNLHGFTP